MNNAILSFESLEPEPKVEGSAVLRERQIKLAKIIEALNALISNPSFKVLKEMVFDGMVEKLEKELKTESSKDELNAPEIYRLQGQIKWAKRYTDFYKLAETYKIELESINKKLTQENYENAITI